MIELRPQSSEVNGYQDGDLDEIVASNVGVHLEMLSDNAIMLIIEDDSRHVHLKITHRGKSPLRVWEYESFDKENLG